MLSFDVANIFVNAAAPAGPWDAFNYAPESKTVYPSAVRQVEGNVVGAGNLVGSGGGGGSAVLEGAGSYVVLDFGKEARLSCPTVYRRSNDKTVVLTLWFGVAHRSAV